MKREEKNALSRKRILEAAAREFSKKGYDGASLNSFCSENGISKGILYHHFKDKDELYLLCAEDCFNRLAAYLETPVFDESDCPEVRLQKYFDARLRFFTENPICLGIFLNSVLYPPAHLISRIAEVRKKFDRQNISILTELLKSAPMREGNTIPTVVDDFRMYMDYFNAVLRPVLDEDESPEQALREHEERCRRQLKILLYGVLEN